MAPDNHNDLPADFGANDWLIEEMFDQYSQDPASVDASWRELARRLGDVYGAGPVDARRDLCVSPGR